MPSGPARRLGGTGAAAGAWVGRGACRAVDLVGESCGAEVAAGGVEGLERRDDEEAIGFRGDDGMRSPAGATLCRIRG